MQAVDKSLAAITRSLTFNRQRGVPEGLPAEDIVTGAQLQEELSGRSRQGGVEKGCRGGQVFGVTVGLSRRRMAKGKARDTGTE